MHTGKLVRASAREKILITDRGQPVALLKSAEAAELIGKPFPKRDIRRMPKVKGDSTTYISEERDAR
jgi:antitoxin (DNA-binding transcriptional repressor) of toxin-antitoxin stability system